MRPPISPLKINKDSCYIKKSQHQHQQRHHPVIIYTHSPKIIHTNPCDFMSLVQKLTGLSSHHHPNSDSDTNYHEIDSNSDENHNSSCNAAVVNSSFPCCIPTGQPIFDPPNTSENGDAYSQNIHNDFGDSLDFLCSTHDPLCSYTDSFFYIESTMKSSITSSPSSSFESMKELPDF
ncbi:nuclear speckle RNA-binding protein B [Solanum dulcamara]|uniref:nuclear speckle RNA-binding protein B n=1 Tax=Solanum dulcamara TaxID=45834 RepID=UPI002485A522|nr:nuclear speckle RNA-binding protein B [Solanum dulcamara]